VVSKLIPQQTNDPEYEYEWKKESKKEGQSHHWPRIFLGKSDMKYHFYALNFHVIATSCQSLYSAQKSSNLNRILSNSTLKT